MVKESMDNNLKKTLNGGLMSGASDEDNQEMLILFHQERLEFPLKEELTELLEFTNESAVREVNLNTLFNKLWNQIRERKRDHRSKPLWYKNGLKVAAALIIGFIIGSLLFSRQERSTPVFYTSVAPKGSVSQMILPDSTFICLNSGSTLKYSFPDKTGKREIILDGEAWFQVQKSADKPFVVHTAYYDINVMGTEFNVKAYPEDANVITTVERGSVTITSGAIKLQESVVLRPGEQSVYFKETRNMVLKNVNTKWFTSWKDNKLIFVNMNLKDLMMLLERKYGVDIRIEDPKILKYHYDGTLKNETILEVLKLLSETLPIRYRINDQTVEIRRK